MAGIRRVTAGIAAPQSHSRNLRIGGSQIQRGADYPGDMNAIPPCIAIAVASILSFTPGITPVADAAPPQAADAGVSINATLTCEIEVIQWQENGEEVLGLPVLVPVQLFDEDSFTDQRDLSVEMTIHNHGPLDANGLANSFVIWGRRIKLFDLTHSIDLVDGDTWVEHVILEPSDLDGHSRLNIIVEADLDDRFLGLIPLPGNPSESCNMQLNRF